MGKDLNKDFSKEDREMAKKAHDKMVDIANYQRNANHNYSEV